MKYFKRLGVYKASNVHFNPAAMVAVSYDWWHFVREIEGKVIFNDYSYSISTSKHQRKVEKLLEELNILYEKIQTSLSLHNFETLEQVYAAHAENLRIEKEHAEKKRLEKNRRARERRAALKLAKLGV